MKNYYISSKNPDKKIEITKELVDDGLLDLRQTDTKEIVIDCNYIIVLDLRECQIDTIDISNAKGLETLLLNENKELPDTMKLVNNSLDKLTIHDCPTLQDLDITGLPNLVSVDADNCSINHFKVNNPKLEYCRLVANKLTNIEGLTTLVNLEHLNISINNFTELDITWLNALKKLDISYNFIDGANFKPNSKSLEYLNMSYQTKDVGEIELYFIPNISEIIAVDCGITEIRLHDTKKLIELDLSNNDIIEFQVEGLKEIREIDLTENHSMTKCIVKNSHSKIFENLTLIGCESVKSLHLDAKGLENIRTNFGLSNIEEIYINSRKMMSILFDAMVF